MSEEIPEGIIEFWGSSLSQLTREREKTQIQIILAKFSWVAIYAQACENTLSLEEAAVFLGMRSQHAQARTYSEQFGRFEIYRTETTKRR